MTKKAVEGLAELSSQLNKLHSKMAAKYLRQAVGQGATPIVKRAKQLVPVGAKEHYTYTGKYIAPGKAFAKASIAKRTKLINGRAVAHVGIRKDAFYAVQFVEVGTRKMGAKPWLVPALKRAQNESIERMKRALEKKIKQAIR